jgi:hypothetical protein
MKNKQLTLTQVHNLRHAATQFGESTDALKEKALALCAHCAVDNAAVLIEYHDCLLFMLAYPANETLYALAENELHRVAAICSRINNGNNQNKKLRIIGTGLPHTTISSAYSIDIVRWLVTRYGNAVSLMGSDIKADEVMRIMALLMPEMEYEITNAKKLTLTTFIKQSKGNSPISDIAWLVQLFDNSTLTAPVKTHLFENLRVFVTIQLDGAVLSRSFLKSIPVETFYHTQPLIRSVNSVELINEKGIKKIKLSAEQKQYLVDVARLSLCMLFRETDTVTQANLNDIHYYDMGRGITIALYGMQPGKRGPIDSYIGYMLFKNNIPASYGGAWMFQDRAKIGVNIYTPFRGGESAYLFCQVMRLYAQLFNVSQFAVEPYQFGKNNKDGLKSGAYWFYYRLGFRSLGEGQRKIAEQEIQKIKTKKNYKTSLETLKFFTHHNVALEVKPVNVELLNQLYDPSELSLAVTKIVAKRFDGDRNKTLQFCKKNIEKALGRIDKSKWTADEKDGFDSMIPLFGLIDDIEQWSVKDKLLLIDIMREKGAVNEGGYNLLLQKHKVLRLALYQLLKS